MKNKGFTLVELLAVIAIIAILAVSAIAGINSIINSQRIKIATESEEAIADSSLSRYVVNNKLYLPACKEDGAYVSFDQSVIKRINDQYRQNVLSHFSSEKAKNDEIKRYVKSINEDKTTTGVKNEFNQDLKVDDLNCFKVTSVASLIDEGYLKDIDNGCDKNTIIIIYKKGESSNPSGKLVSLQEQGICKGSRSEAKGPLITVSPEKNLSNEAIKKVQVTITDEDGNLPNSTELYYAWTTESRNPPSSSEWQHVSLSLTDGKFKTTFSKQGLDEEFYFWIRDGSVTDKKGYSNSTFSTGPYAFLATPEITYKTKNNGRCSGETTCSDKTRTVVYSKSYQTNPDGSTTSLCTPECVGYTFLTWKKDEVAIRNTSIVSDKRNHELNAVYDANKYIVSFSQNGGKDWTAALCPSPRTFTSTGKKCTKQVTYDDPYGNLGTAERKGYTFTGWYTSASGGTKIESTTTVKIVSPQTLYAHWSPNTYVVTLDSAGGTACSESPKSIVYDTKYNISCAPTKTGYIFAGWYNGTTKIEANTTLTTDSDHTLTAHWTPITYKVKFNGNTSTGGTMSDLTCTYDTDCTLTANAFSKTGYTFSKWTTNANGTGTSYNNSQSVLNLTSTNNATINIYAKWTPNTYVIAYNANNGSGSMSNITCTYDSACTLTTNSLTRTGYTFGGWATSESGSATYSNGESVTNLSTSGTVNLYAVWNPIPYTLHVSAYLNNVALTNMMDTLVNKQIGTFTVNVDGTNVATNVVAFHGTVNYNSTYTITPSGYTNDYKYVNGSAITGTMTGDKTESMYFQRGISNAINTYGAGNTSYITLYGVTANEMIVKVGTTSSFSYKCARNSYMQIGWGIKGTHWEQVNTDATGYKNTNRGDALGFSWGNDSSSNGIWTINFSATNTGYQIFTLACNPVSSNMADGNAIQRRIVVKFVP